MVVNRNVIREQCERALRRIHYRTYGICEECSRPIIKDRLLDNTPGNTMRTMSLMADGPPATKTASRPPTWGGFTFKPLSPIRAEDRSK